LKFQPDIILIASTFFLQLMFIQVYSIIKKVKTVKESCEVPYYRKEYLTKMNKFWVKAEYNLYDGLIVITDRLKELFQKELEVRAKMIVVPILSNSGTGVSNGILKDKRTLVYTGSLHEHKDGITIILKAFAEIHKKHSEIKLIMTGDLNSSGNKTKILELVKELNISNNVEFPGYVSIEELKEITSSATALLLAKPDNRQNRYNMATKIGEYLLTSRPALISSVDPASQILKHRENVLIASPEVDSFVNEILFVLNNPDKADEIGTNGRVAALEIFDYKYHGMRINDFFLDLCEKK